MRKLISPLAEAGYPMLGAKGPRLSGKAFPRQPEAQEQALAAIASWLSGSEPSPEGAPGREGKPTHNHDIFRYFGYSIDAKGAGRGYAAMKADERFSFQPEGMPASFAA